MNGLRIALLAALITVAAASAPPPAAADACEPTQTENSHEPSGTITERLPLIRVSFDDEGRQCLLRSLTVVVDGVVVGASYTTSDTAPHYTISYQPIFETDPGAGLGTHTVLVRIEEWGCDDEPSLVVTCEGGAAAWSYSIADPNNVPDAVESQICGRALFRDALDDVEPNAGHCETNTDYVAPTQFGGLNFPTEVSIGPDDDGDGFPISITVKRQRVTITPFDPSVVATREAPDLVLTIDGDDGDPNVPADSVVTVPFPVVTSWSFGVDSDGDGVPITVTLGRTWISFDRLGGADAVGASAAPSQTEFLDPDDEDPDVPVQSLVPAPSPIVSGYEFGEDGDRDGVPSGVYLTKTWYTFDRRAPSTLGSAPAPADYYVIDPDDADANVPAQSVFGPFKIPTAVFGVDADGDRIPGTVTVTYWDITVDRTAANPLTSDGHSETFEIDPDDGTPGTPPADLNPFDGDRDDIPDALEPSLCKVQNENDPDDGDCSTPTDYQAPATIPNPWRRS